MYISPQDLSLIFKIYILNILIQDIYHIFDLCSFVEIFSLCVVSFFILLTVSLEEQALLILMNSQFICVFFMNHIFEVISIKTLLNLRS